MARIPPDLKYAFFLQEKRFPWQAANVEQMEQANALYFSIEEFVNAKVESRE